MDRHKQYPIIALFTAGVLSIILFGTNLWAPHGISYFLAKGALLFLISFLFVFVYPRRWWQFMLSIALAPLFIDVILTVLNIILEKNMWFIILDDWVDEKFPLVIVGVLPGCLGGLIFRNQFEKTGKR